MTLVDGYMIPDDKAEQYIAAREKCAALVLDILKDKYAYAERMFKGSQDGEAVVGLDKNRQLEYLIHLDPPNIIKLSRAIKRNRLKEYIENDILINL